jgi:hypothetical protein
MLRTLSFWALLIVGTIALVQLASSRRREEAEITYTQFMEELNAGNVGSVEIAERQKVRGTFQRPVVVKRQTVERFNVLLPFEADDSFVAGLSAKGVDVRAREAGQSFGVVLLTFLPYLLIFGLVIFMLRQMQQGGNRAFAFGKSKAKLLAGDTPKVTFADVAGCDEAKQELEEIIDFLKDPQKFQRLGRREPARRCSPRPSRGKPAGRSSPCRARTSSRCSSAWAPRACATCSSRARRTLRASSSSTKSTRSAATAAPAWAAGTTSASRRSISCSSRWTGLNRMKA